MKFLLLIVNAEEAWMMLSEADQQRQIGAMNAFTDQLKRAGVYVSCGGLAPSAHAKTVRLAGAVRTVSDGVAFRLPETRDMVTGFFIVETPQIDDAIPWANKMPIIAGAIEVRPIAME